MSRVVTVTPNPSLDRTVNVASWRRGEIHRVEPATLEPSGKGVNVSIALRVAGQPTLAVLPTGGGNGQELAAMLDALELPYKPVPIAGSVRSNLAVIEADGTTTKFNEPGPTLTAAEIRALVDAAERNTAPGDWIAWCGSLPPGFGADALAEAVAAARSAGRRVALDTSGAALAALLDGPRHALPSLVKPNADELADVVGRQLPTLDDVAVAARGLVARGVGTVLVSLGGEGAVLADADGVLHGGAPVPTVVNTAGAGDAFLAGYLAAPPGAGRADRLASALRFGAAAVGHSGTLLTNLGPPPATTIDAVPEAQKRP